MWGAEVKDVVKVVEEMLEYVDFCGELKWNRQDYSYEGPIQI